MAGLCVGVLAAMLGLSPMAANPGQWYSSLWLVDDYNIFFHVVFLFIAGMTILGSIDFLKRENINHGEYYSLLLFATVGMLMMSGSNELVMIFLGLEILSIATYVLSAPPQGVQGSIAVAPFHIWTPDVYEGAPTPVTGFMSVGPKAAGFAVRRSRTPATLPSLLPRAARAASRRPCSTCSPTAS